jgi:hypothetical protein
MGPAAEIPLRAPTAPDPHAVQVLKRTNERKLAGWANDPGRPELMVELVPQPHGFEGLLVGGVLVDL